MSTPTRPPRPDRAPEQLISALLPDITAGRPVPPPILLAALPAPSPTRIDAMGAVLLGTAHVDRSGRFHERTLLRALGWDPGRELDLDTMRDTILIVAAVGGVHRVDHRGAIALPAGAPVVLVADVRRQRLVVHPAAAVIRLLADSDSGLIGAGDDG